MKSKFNMLCEEITNDLILEDEILLEGKVLDLIKKFGNKLKNVFKSEKNPEELAKTLILLRLEKEKDNSASQVDIENIEKIEQVLPKQKTAVRFSNIDKLSKEDKDKLYQDLSDLDKAMIENFGPWWKSHMISRMEFDDMLRTFRSKNPGVAMPIY